MSFQCHRPATTGSRVESRECKANAACGSSDATGGVSGRLLKRFRRSEGNVAIDFIRSSEMKEAELEPDEIGPVANRSGNMRCWIQ